MFAKDEKTQHTLRDNWHQIVFDRRYVAVVTGEMEKDSGIVLGHPIIGDGRYGIEDLNPIGRLALHAFKLCFYHPVTGEKMEFETPYPPSFKNLLVKK